MNKSNFFIRDNKIYDLDGAEILPDENGVINVILHGYERRFKADRFVNFLELNKYMSFFKSPLKPKKIKVVKEKVVRIKKEKPIKVPRVKKEPRRCACGVVISGKVKCRNCFESSKKVYQKVTFDKRCNNGNHGFTKRPIICSNGKIYESMTAAQNELGITKSTIWNICNKKWKNSKGVNFRYAENG